jgi:glutathione peroxidase
MLAPTVVKGAQANPIFKELNRQSHEPTWNFNKYLVAPNGKVVGYFDSEVTPESPELTQAIAKLLD